MILISLNSDVPVKCILFIIGLWRKKFKGMERKNITYLDCVNNKLTISDGYKSYSYGHKNTAGNYNKASINIPKIELYQFYNAQVVSNSSHIITDTTVYVERIGNVNAVDADYCTGLLFEHSDKHALIECRPISREVEKAIFMGGNGSFNYYHWLVEILPKFKYFSKSIQIDSTISILLSKSVADTPSFYDLFKKVFNGNLDNVIFMEPGAVYLVKSLYHLTSPSNLVFNLRGQEFKPSYSYFRYEALDYVKKTAYELCVTGGMKFTKRLPSKIFLARRSKIRNYNQNEVALKVNKLGFESIYIEDYPFFQQVKIFKNARVIIGPTGAAWANLIFCSPNVKCLCWMSKRIGDFSGFSNLAAYSQAELYYIYHECDLSDHLSNEYHSDYIINVNEIILSLEKINAL